jgi:hypothetical protein
VASAACAVDAVGLNAMTGAPSLGAEWNCGMYPWSANLVCAEAPPTTRPSFGAFGSCEEGSSVFCECWAWALGAVMCGRCASGNQVLPAHLYAHNVLHIGIHNVPRFSLQLDVNREHASMVHVAVHAFCAPHQADWVTASVATCDIFQDEVETQMYVQSLVCCSNVAASNVVSVISSGIRPRSYMYTPALRGRATK